jgi:hypothetical protein
MFPIPVILNWLQIGWNMISEGFSFSGLNQGPYLTVIELNYKR